MEKPKTTTPAWILELRAKLDTEKQAKDKKTKSEAFKQKNQDRARKIFTRRLFKKLRKQEKQTEWFQERLARDKD